MQHDLFWCKDCPNTQIFIFSYSFDKKQMLRLIFYLSSFALNPLAHLWQYCFSWEQSTQTSTMAMNSEIKRGGLSADFSICKTIQRKLVCSVMVRHSQFCTKTLPSSLSMQSLSWFTFRLLSARGQRAPGREMQLEWEVGSFRSFYSASRMCVSGDQCTRAVILSWAEKRPKAT